MKPLNYNLLRFGNISTYIITLIVNSLANTTIFGGRTTADVSFANPTLITPATYTFAIWGVIYVLLGIFIVYQALPSQKDKPFHEQISFLFILTSIFNVGWILLWQYNFLVLSVVLILAFTASLIAIYLRLNIGRSKVSLTEKLAVHVPFSVYLGWLTIATIADVSVTLLNLGWNGFGVSAQTWAIVVLVLALIVTLAVIVTRRDIAYSLVIVWALVGIAVGQSSYALTMLVVEVAVAVIIVALVLTVGFHQLWSRRGVAKNTQAKITADSKLGA